MLKDRGSIKWTSLMLPEHVQMLKDLWQEDKTSIQPLLDEQMLDELNQHLQTAFSQNKKVRLTVHLNGQKQKLIGIIVRICENEKTIYLKTTDGITRTIQVCAITNLQQIQY